MGHFDRKNWIIQVETKDNLSDKEILAYLQGKDQQFTLKNSRIIKNNLKGLLLFLLSLYTFCAFSQKCERIIICGFDCYVSPIINEKHVVSYIQSEASNLRLRIGRF